MFVADAQLAAGRVVLVPGSGAPVALQRCRRRADPVWSRARLGSRGRGGAQRLGVRELARLPRCGSPALPTGTSVGAGRGARLWRRDLWLPRRGATPGAGLRHHGLRALADRATPRAWRESVVDDTGRRAHREPAPQRVDPATTAVCIRRYARPRCLAPGHARGSCVSRRTAGAARGRQLARRGARHAILPERPLEQPQHGGLPDLQLDDPGVVAGHAERPVAGESLGLRAARAHRTRYRRAR